MPRSIRRLDVPRWLIGLGGFGALWVLAVAITRSAIVGLLVSVAISVAAIGWAAYRINKDVPPSLRRVAWALWLTPGRVLGVDGSDDREEITEVRRRGEILPRAVCYRLRSVDIPHSYKVLEARRGTLYSSLNLERVEVEEGGDHIDITFVGLECNA